MERREIVRVEAARPLVGQRRLAQRVVEAVLHERVDRRVDPADAANVSIDHLPGRHLTFADRPSERDRRRAQDLPLVHSLLIIRKRGMPSLRSEHS
ncbi:MAG: hypothetical protein K0S65_6598 [Labilithrix sp.]|nr:hypothetical protein [Labilithrix sp.]